MELASKTWDNWIKCSMKDGSGCVIAHQGKRAPKQEAPKPLSFVTEGLVLLAEFRI